MHPFFGEQKKKIQDFLQSWLLNDNPYKELHFLSKDICEKLYNFSISGKMIRGGLAALSFDLFSNDHSVEVTKLGAGIELFQSALLIHDDIMDRDFSRRGSDTIFYQYIKMAEFQKLNDPYHTGEALGICSGDFAFFLAIDLISLINTSFDKYKRLSQICSREIAFAGMAQMMDVYNGTSASMPDQQDIILVYKFKTGRYTFSLPLAAGAILAGCDDNIIDLLKSMGENLGVIFQVKDDELSLFGDEQMTGKPVGSDLKEGKKTLLICLIYETASTETKNRILSILGDNVITTDSINFIRNLAETPSIKKSIQGIVDNYTKTVREQLIEIPVINSNAKKIFEEFIDYNLIRTK